MKIWIQNWHFTFDLIYELLLHFSLSTNENCIKILRIVTKESFFLFLESFEFIHLLLRVYISIYSYTKFNINM